MGEEKRCTGHCCRAFNIGGHKALMERYLQVGRKEARGEELTWWDKEVILLWRICLPLPAQKSKQGDNAYEPVSTVRTADSEDGSMHTCLWLDRQTGDCTHYDERPSMCRSYPDGKPCVFVHCTSDKALRNTPGNGVPRDELIPVGRLLMGGWVKGPPRVRTVVELVDAKVISSFEDEYGPGIPVEPGTVACVVVEKG